MSENVAPILWTDGQLFLESVFFERGLFELYIGEFRIEVYVLLLILKHLMKVCEIIIFQGCLFWGFGLAARLIEAVMAEIVPKSRVTHIYFLHLFLQSSENKLITLAIFASFGESEGLQGWRIGDSGEIE